ncbi:MAG TPA: hypothetical protein VHB21_02230 [Minicystis sp.]|nr:hypothetical protein [Minicystis sp.]
MAVLAEVRMHSVRSFLSLWSIATASILAYAFVDLGMNPGLYRETHFSMQPDLSRVGELVHWGGRLLKERHWSLLVSNALVLGGLTALALGALGRALRTTRGASPPDDAAADDARASLP